MYTHETEKDGLRIILYFYSAKVCEKEAITLYGKETVRISLKAKTLKLVEDNYLTVCMENSNFWIKEENGKTHKIAEEGYCRVLSNAQEEILIILLKERKSCLSCHKISFLKGHAISIGSTFRCDIFYEYFSFLEEKKLSLNCEERGILLDTDCRFVYCNGDAVSEKIYLKKGDKLEILGLQIWVLPLLLVVVCNYGEYKIAMQKDRERWKPEREEKAVRVRTRNIQRKKREDRELPAKVMELEKPETLNKQTQQPLFFSLGPALTMLLPVLCMMFAGIAVGEGKNGGLYYLTFIMTFTSALVSSFWTLAGRAYRKKNQEKNQIRRKEKYLEYLERIRKYLEQVRTESTEILKRKYPPCAELWKEEKGEIVYENRNKWQNDFWFVRLGTGKKNFPVELQVSLKEKEISNDKLLELLYSLKKEYQYLEKSPIGIDLREVSCVGFFGEGVYLLLFQFIMQLVSGHNDKELKIAYFYHENRKEETAIADGMKWLSHCWQRRIRFLAGNEKEAGEILPYLTNEIRNRMDGKEEEYEDIWVIIVAAAEWIAGEEIYRYLTHVPKGKAYKVFFANEQQEKIAGACNCLVIKDGKREEIIRYETEYMEKHETKFDEGSFEQAQIYMRKLATLSNETKKEGDVLSEKVSFLNLYHCKKVQELQCPKRWKENKVRERMRVPIGQGNGGKNIYLDIHEKFHGPHGLVAGMTGAGKSELLQTYLLSLAVSFSPQEIIFFIIDYKGGGMGKVLEDLPHMAGSISNLSGKQIRRALLSVKSEIIRRQKIFEKYGVSHVDEYEGEEPIAHLLLVVDEFAELKREEPEFMQEIISISQIGRSLGIHLLLATQKPAGTVDDKIWSNTGFRLCLKVADKQDSMDMLHRQDAALLKDAGNCFLQVGNDELFELFQAGYGKVFYCENADEEKAVMLSRTGKRTVPKRYKEGCQLTQIEKVINYIQDVAKENGYGPARKLWLDELPDRLNLRDMQMEEKGKENGNYDIIQISLGVIDNPLKQRREMLVYNPLAEGHLCLFGMPALGKSTFLQTLLWQLCCYYTPGQVRFLLAFSEYAGVNCFADMPHCLGTMNQKQEAECFFYHVKRMVSERKRQLSGISYAQYCKQNPGKLPLILFLVDNYGSFRQLTEDLHEPVIEQLAKSGEQYGIYLVMTALGIGNTEINSKLFDKMKVTLTLEMSEKVQYADILRKYPIPVSITGGIKGRGLCVKNGDVLEFQVPLMKNADDYGRIEVIKELIRNKGKKKDIGNLDKFPKIPEEAVWKDMQNSLQQTERIESRQIPIGYQLNSGYIQKLDCKDPFYFLITGNKKTGKKNLLFGMMQELEKIGIQIQVLTKADKINTILQEDICLVIPRLHEFAREMEGKEEWESIIKKRKISILAVLETQYEGEIMGTFWQQLFRREQNGIHMGGRLTEERILSFEELGYSRMNQAEGCGIGYLKMGFTGEIQKILVPKADGEIRDDFSGYSGTGT